MMQSMTGYGEARQGNVYCEIKSLNHRFFNVNFSIPSWLSPYEFKIIELLKRRIKRGAVSLKIYTDNYEIKPDIERAKAYYNFVLDLKQELGLSGTIPIGHFLDFKKETTGASWKDVKTAINSAISLLVKSRDEEGKKLKADIELHLKKVKEGVEHIKQGTPDVRDIRKQFKKKFAAFVRDGLDERKLKEELTLWLIRENFNEERVRLEVHLSKFKQVLRKRGPSGKYLSFLIQEMEREANTISAKAKNAKISQLIVELKGELEILREQIGNVR
ncbi:YicC family protein [candidate division WOR-3 bacterium]|nr:YicC family protein [candidate division WOR-3 bacterium]